jgi:thiosulfate/3-mercaptopyruvate sulfurtransferase
MISLLRNFSTKVTSGGAFINAMAAKSLLDSNKAVKFLDVRAPEEYKQYHIPTAVNCHKIFTYLSTSTEDGVIELINTFQDEFQRAGINGDEHVITYEAALSTLFGASCRGYYLLKLLGHPAVSILNGGVESWLQHGYTTSTETPQVKRGTFKAVWTPGGSWSDKHDVLNAINRKDAVLLDVRDLDEWNGVSSSPYGVDFAPRKGRLPGAVHILWKDFMEKDENGLTRLKNPQEISNLCSSKGISIDDKIIIYCFKGARASNTYIALKEAGFLNVTNYFSSWNEWSRDPDLIIDDKIYY